MITSNQYPVLTFSVIFYSIVNIYQIAIDLEIYICVILLLVIQSDDSHLDNLKFHSFRLEFRSVFED